MKTILIDLNTNEATVYTVKADLCRKLGITAGTLWNWSKQSIKQTKDHLICFNVLEYNNKTKLRKHYF